MANSGERERFRHFLLEDLARTERYESPRQRGSRQEIPRRARGPHGERLLQQMASVRESLAAAVAAQETAGMEDGLGLSIEFESFPDIELAFESLARERSGIELLNVRHSGAHTLATVFVPEGKLQHFERQISDYLEERRDSRGYARDHQRLIDAIQTIRLATLEALWTDARDALPLTDSEDIWWEVWLPARRNPKLTVHRFRDLAEAQGLRVAFGEVEFPERSVVLVYGSAETMKRSMLTLNSIAELRRAKETADFFDELDPGEQAEWTAELLARTEFPEPASDPPVVCILDTGVNRGHPLLAPVLDKQDQHTVQPAWGVDDAHGHGTEMAGLAVAGNLADVLDSTAPLKIRHRLESVKLLPGPGSNTTDARHHGYLTTEAVLRPEITAPDRSRVVSMAVTARDNRDRGRPSAWSAAVDRLAADAENQGENPRLLVVSAGNVERPDDWLLYPASNLTDGIHDPAQAWNALTVGAYTELVTIDDPLSGDLQPIASAGGLSPFSTTSNTWDNQWPLKPDVLMEGGNAARDGLGATTTPSLRLLTAHHDVTRHLFATTNATSAATALAARMAAQLMQAYPALWPETVRGLIVHSARWTDDMQTRFLPLNPNKQHYKNLVRTCGFGVPSPERAEWSVANSLTMLSQELIHPFAREDSGQPKLRDLHLFALPWPSEALEALGEEQVEMRVTLSYFIEPNPSTRGPRSRYRYESHGLRFDVKRPHETLGDFHARINAAARDEEVGTVVAGTDPNWLLGKHLRHRGSLHNDIWRGTAADLASRGAVAVYPSIGWWKTRPHLERYLLPVRYALLISVGTPGVEVDLATEVAARIGVPIEIEA
jgi:Subtilase family